MQAIRDQRISDAQRVERSRDAADSMLASRLVSHANLPRAMRAAAWSHRRLRSSSPVRARSARATSRRRRSSGRPTAPISPARATRRSIRSTGRISRSCRSPGGSRPIPSVRGPTSSTRRRRWWSATCSTPPPARAARSSRSTPPPARCSGCTPRTRARVARTRPAQRRGTGRLVLVERRRIRSAHPLRHARLPDDRAQRQDRRADPDLRQGRRRRPEAGERSGTGSRDRRPRPECHAARRGRRGRRRRRPALQRFAAGR